MLGSWHIRFTRFMTGHVVRKQEQVNSCGIACVLMVNFKIKKGLMFAGISAGGTIQAVPVVGSYLGSTLSSAAIDYAIKTEPEIYKVYGDVVGTVYDGTTYTNGLQHPEVLRRIGLGNWECVNLGENGVAGGIVRATDKGAPCILHIAWDGGGAHFVVVDETVRAQGRRWCMINDPGDGDVHPTRLTVGSRLRFQTGKATGWIIRRK